MSDLFSSRFGQNNPERDGFRNGVPVDEPLLSHKKRKEMSEWLNAGLDISGFTNGDLGELKTWKPAELRKLRLAITS